MILWKKYVRIATDGSENLDSPEYSYGSDNLDTPGAKENSFKHTLFHRIVAYNQKKKENFCVMKPAKNSRGVKVAGQLFVNKKDVKNTDKSCINKDSDVKWDDAWR